MPGLFMLRMRRGVAVGSFMVLVATCALLLVGRSGSRAIRDDLEAASRALGPRRSIMARLSDLPYQVPPGPVATVGHAGGAVAPEVILRLRHAARSTHPSDLRAGGAFALLTGETETAAALLSEAVAIRPGDAASRTDLAAAYMTMADGEPEERRTEVLARAVDAATVATSLDPGLSAGWFNLALALERIGLRDRARIAWQRFVDIEMDPGWRHEGEDRARVLAGNEPLRDWDRARQRLAGAGTPADVADIHRMVDAFRQPTREYVEDELLPAWARAYLAGDHASETSRLEQLHRVVDALTHSTRDSLLASVIDAIQHGGGTARDAIARGCVAYAAGRLEYEANHYEAAGVQFGEGRAAFLQAGSAFGEITEYQLGIVEFQLRQLDAARSRLEAVTSVASQRGHTSVRARALLVHGLASMQSGDVEQALADYESALRQFEQLGEHENVVNAANTAADTLRVIGQHSVGWAYLGTALRGLDTLRSARRRYVALLNASLYAADDELQAAALQFQDASLAAARERGVANTLVEGYTRRANLYIHTGRLTSAREDLDAADALLGSIDSDASRRYQTAWLQAVRGEYLLRTRPAEAFDVFDAAIAYFEHGEPAEVPGLYLRLGRTALAMGDDSRAESALRTGIDWFERRWRTLVGTAHRVSYLDEGWSLFEEMIHLYGVRRRQPDQAFTFAESARARDLEQNPPATEAAPTPDDLRALLPHDGVIVYYALLQQQLLTWTITPAQVRFAIAEQDESHLVEQVGAYRRLLEAQRPAAEVARLATALYDAILRPALRDVASDSTVVIVPDGILHALPFATLRDSRTGEYAIQQHAIGVAPSAKALVRSSQHLGSVARLGPSVLAVGNSRPPASETLPALPNTSEELSQVAQLYPQATILSDVGATPEAFAGAAPTAAVIHFAGHARVNLRFPDLSQLILAPSPTNPRGVLDAQQLRAWQLPRTDLVVLAACETAYGSVYRGEGIISLARPFLNAGVASVVGSLWDVDDRATRLLLTDFHRRYLVSRDPILALRDAQRAAITSSDPRMREPDAWGGFTAVSGIRPATPDHSTAHRY